MIIEALELRAPTYGHVSLLVGKDGAPLSKRLGDPTIRSYRERGYSAATITNHLFRLGHSTSENGFLTLEEMARHFNTAHLGRAPAKFDEQQLTMWQKEWVNRLTPETARSWLSAVIPAQVDERAARAFVEAIMHNVVLPEDAVGWAQIVFGDLPPLDAADEQVVRDAGSGYFQAAASAAASSEPDLKAIVNSVKAATGRTGAALYKPLRLALTGRTHGPELAPLLKAMPPGKARERLARFAA
jgi:glutamyl/glutaminyl-tRNA synthetase